MSIAKFAISSTIAATAISAFAAFDDNTIAFYGFGEGVAGETAYGKTVLNAVDASAHPGSVLLVGDGTAADITFDGDVPGRYVFVGTPTASSKPVYSGLKSINSYYLGSDTGVNALNGGEIDFAGLATALSSNEEFTIEFFYKIPVDQAGIERIKPMMSFDLQSEVVYLPTSTSQGRREMQLFLNMKYSFQTGSFARPRIGTSWGFNNTFRIFNYGWTGSGCTDLADGEWHHIAITYSGGAYVMWCDYYSTSSADSNWGAGSLSGTLYRAGHEPQTIQRPLKLFNGIFRGKVAGLRVSRGVLDRSQFLRAFDFPDTHTLFHWKFDGAAEESLPSVVTNDAPNYAMSLANQFCRKGDCSSLMALTGNGLRMDSDNGTAPAYSSSVWRKYVCIGKEVVSTNRASAYFRPDSISSVNPGISVSRSAIDFTYGGDFTLEAFVRFDFDSWRERIGDSAEGEKYVDIFGVRIANGYLCRLYAVVNAQGDFVGLNNTVVKNAGGTKSASDLRLFKAGRWHHVALVYDSSTKTFTTYVDRVAAISLDMSEEVPYFVSTGYFYFGAQHSANSGNGAPFEGLMDEVRLSNVVLAPEEFLSASNSSGKSGVILVFK